MNTLGAPVVINLFHGDNVSSPFDMTQRH